MHPSGGRNGPTRLPSLVACLGPWWNSTSRGSLAFALPPVLAGAKGKGKFSRIGTSTEQFDFFFCTAPLHEEYDSVDSGNGSARFEVTCRTGADSGSAAGHQPAKKVGDKIIRVAQSSMLPWLLPCWRILLAVAMYDLSRRN
jgi:hypothetical protein